MQVIFKQSPSVAHKYQVTLPNKIQIHFGKINVHDYTDHKDPMMMRKQLIARGGMVPLSVRSEKDKYEVHREMLLVKTSAQEDWDDVNTTEYWERWLLYSYPTLHQSKLWMTMREGILFSPCADDFFYLRETT